MVELRQQVRVGGVAVVEGKLLLGRMRQAGWWCVPGGRIEAGESGAQALSRELREELPTTAGEVGPLCAVIETAFTHADVHYQEVGLYFRIEGLQPSEAGLTGREGELELVFHWWPLIELDQVDVRPPPLRDVARGTQPFVHLVNIDR